MTTFLHFPNAWQLAGKLATTLLAALLLSEAPLHAQSELLTNLGAFPRRIPVGDPFVAAADESEGPKGIATADFNGDGKPDLAVSNLDATITVLFGLGGGAFSLPPEHILTGAKELRSVLAADLNGDGKPDLATTSFEDGKLLLFFNDGSGNFGAAIPLPAWVGVRALASGDFDGDGIADLAAAGPGLGVRHFRGTGDFSDNYSRAFEVMGDNKQLSPHYQNLTRTRPVYALRTLRSRDGLRDDLLVTHADSPSLWILSTAPVDLSTEPPVDPASLPAWKNNPSPVLLTEAQVQNADTLLDADGTAQPWVELLNKSAAPVDLAGWKLSLESNSGPQDWEFPAVTIQPGRFLIVFLSGKNITSGPELHAWLVLKENTDQVSLLQPAGAKANTIDLPGHVVTGISRGLAPDADQVQWFDIPSPGMENNAGESTIDDISQEIVTTLTITPREPAPEEPVTVRVTMPEKPTGSSNVRNVWFSATPGLTEVHHLLERISPGIFEATLPPGSFAGNTPHRVLARLWDGIDDRNDYTVQMHPGLDEPEASIAVTPRPGCLLPVASIPSPKVKAFEVGPVFSPATQPGAPADLIYVDEEEGLLQVHRAVSAGARRFAPVAASQVEVAGAPRDVKLADTNADGWLDVTVVKRGVNLIHTFKNVSGNFIFDGEIPTGASPREVVMADFTGDGRPDAAVINRHSADISILPSGAGLLSGLVSLNQIYGTDGDVGALLVADFNGDGRDDVLQLHRASGEVSVRYSAPAPAPAGRLDPPVFFLLGPQGLTGAQGACAATLADVNGDTRPDVVTANLGIENDGSISVLLGKSGGGFETARVFSGVDKLFAVTVADFDNDGKQDIAAGLWDCRISFFRGTGDGDFVAVAVPVPFVIESRVMVARDFDKDGDIDIAGAGYEGDMVTLENLGVTSPGNWVTGWNKFRYGPPEENVDYAAERIGLTWVNGDKDPDLIIGTARGVLLYRGGTNMAFDLVDTNNAGGMNLAVSDVFTADIDHDGDLEMVTACSDAACVTVLHHQSDDDLFYSGRQYAVPSARYIATGDLDGDGYPDLIGTGHSLWTVLSSREPEVSRPDSAEMNRHQFTHVVINEVLGRNTGVPVPADNGAKSDFIEIFNGAGTTGDLRNWTLQVESAQEGTPVNRTWPLPAIVIPAKGRTVIVCAEGASSMHTGFTLPAEGGTLTLRNGDGAVVDRVVYPRAQENVSWSRYHDGHPTFHADPIPSPGLGNLDNGNAPPTVTLTPPSPSALRANQPLTFTARGRDGLGIVSMSLFWNRLDAPPGSPLVEPQRLVLFDNGQAPDVTALDGIFTGRMQGLPSGAEVQFYLEAVNISGEMLRLPEDAVLSAPGDPPVAWSFAIAAAPTLEISEVSTNNVKLRRDELGGSPDYVTVRHTGPPGSAPIDMSNILLAKSLLSDASSVYSFPSGFTLPQGGEVTVFADGQIDQGPFHAPFSFDAGGDDISLLAVRPSGGRQWSHSVAVPEMEGEDLRYLRLTGTDLHAVVAATADLNNWAGVSYDANGTASATVRFLAATGSTYIVQGDFFGAPVAWAQMMAPIPGNSSVVTISRPLTQYSALRVVPNPLTPAISVTAIGGISYTAATGTFGTAGISGEARGFTGLTLYYGPTNGGTNPAAWSRSIGGYNMSASEIVPFAWFLNNLPPNATYYYSVKADLPGGGASWPAVGTAVGTFRTLTSTHGAATSLALTQLNPTNATVQIDLSPSAPVESVVELLAGPVDAGTNYAAWPIRLPATRIVPGGTAWTASLTSLARNTNFFVRARVTSSTGQFVSAQRLAFRMPDAKANLALNLRVSEIMYHPPDPYYWMNFVNPVEGAAEIAAGYGERDFEFIELYNASDEDMDLSGLWFGGIDFDFPPFGATVIPPGGYAVIAANPHAFATRYGAHIPLAGWTLHPFRNSRLANGGEQLTLSTADGTVLFDLLYPDRVILADGRPSRLSDGGGSSLEYHMPADVLRPEVPEDYRDSAFGGTPGGTTPVFTSPTVTYDAWKLLNFSAAQANDPGFSGMEIDCDHDGLTNLAEYAHGTSPLAPDAESVLGFSLHPDGSVPYDSFSFIVNWAADATFVLESSTDGAAWQTKMTYSYGEFPLYYNVELLPGGRQIKVSVQFYPSLRPPRQFWRLRITNE